MTMSLNFKAVLAVPSLCTGMERHIARCGLRILSQLPDSRVGILPINFIFARVDRFDDFICVFIGERFSGVERPAAIINALVIRFEVRVAAFGNDYAPPAQRLELRHCRVLEGNRLHTGGQSRIKPEHEPLVDDRVDRSATERVHSALVARTTVKLETAAPGFEISEGKAVER